MKEISTNYFVSILSVTNVFLFPMPRDLCTVQLLSIVHEIQTTSDSNPTVDVRSVFLDISKTFDKVWHGGLLLKLKSYGVEGELFSLLESYLNSCEQKVVLNDQTSDLKGILSGVPQGLVSGPLLFLIYINDLPDDLTYLCKSFGDDTSFFFQKFLILTTPGIN